jgi:hypothetical protein
LLVPGSQKDLFFSSPALRFYFAAIQAVNRRTKEVAIATTEQFRQINKHLGSTPWADAKHIIVMDFHGDFYVVAELFFDIKHKKPSLLEGVIAPWYSQDKNRHCEYQALQSFL